jgi:hypothetical protein
MGRLLYSPYINIKISKILRNFEGHDWLKGNDSNCFLHASG